MLITFLLMELFIFTERICLWCYKESDCFKHHEIHHIPYLAKFKRESWLGGQLPTEVAGWAGEAANHKWWWLSLISLWYRWPLSTWRKGKEHLQWGGERATPLSLIHSLSSVLSLSERPFAYLCLLCCLKDLWAQHWLQGCRHAHTNGVFCAKWLWSLSIALHCHCVVSLFISHTACQLHMAQRVLPPTPCLSRSLSHSRTDMQLSIVCGPLTREQKLNSVSCCQIYERMLHGHLLYMLEIEREILCHCVALDFVHTQRFCLILFEYLSNCSFSFNTS